MTGHRCSCSCCSSTARTAGAAAADDQDVAKLVGAVGVAAVGGEAAGADLLGRGADRLDEYEARQTGREREREGERTSAREGKQPGSTVAHPLPRAPMVIGLYSVLAASADARLKGLSPTYSVLKHFQLLVSHSRTVLSSPAVIKQLPSALKHSTRSGAGCAGAKLPYSRGIVSPELRMFGANLHQDPAYAGVGAAARPTSCEALSATTQMIRSNCVPKPSF